jgi:hypothetical protein
LVGHIDEKPFTTGTRIGQVRVTTVTQTLDQQQEGCRPHLDLPPER